MDSSIHCFGLNLSGERVKVTICTLQTFKEYLHTHTCSDGLFLCLLFLFKTKKTKGKGVSSFVPDDDDDDDEDDYDDGEPDPIDDDDICEYFDGTKVTTAYNKAQKKKKTK